MKTDKIIVYYRKEELLNVGIKAGMNKNVCKKIMTDIHFIVNQELNEYLK